MKPFNFNISSFRETWNEYPSSRRGESYDDSFRDREEAKSDFDDRPEVKEVERNADYELKLEKPFEKSASSRPATTSGAAVPPPPLGTNQVISLRPKNRPEPKKIDLGAAALYAKQFQKDSIAEGPSPSDNDLLGISSSATNSNGAAPSGGADLLTDLFGEMGVGSSKDTFDSLPSGISSAQNGNNFADFSQFDSNDSNDDFSDFQSAFGPSPAVSAASPAGPDNSTANFQPILLNSDPSFFQESPTTNSNTFAAMNSFMPQSNPPPPQLMPQTLTPTPLMPALAQPKNTANESTPRIGKYYYDTFRAASSS